MKRNMWISTVFAMILMGCTTFHVVKPTYPYPKVHGPNPTVVNSLQPTFKWEPSKNADAYDFIIYEGIKEESFWKGTQRAVGREVCYREALTTTEYTIEEPLKPDTEYYWSVRTRCGQTVSDWSLYDYTLFMGTAYVKKTNAPFLFKTPKAGK